MKRILIVGDSWAIVPCNLLTLQHLHQKNDWKENTEDLFDWLDFRLLARGHSVSNRSWGGSANWFQLSQVEAFLRASKKNKFHIDIVIWFHTEVLRDRYFNNYDPNSHHPQIIKQKGLNELIDHCAFEAYQYARKISTISPTTKWAIIGGHAPLYNKYVNILDFADFIIPDLRYVITGKKFPECHTLSFKEPDWNFLKNDCNVSIEYILDELEKAKVIHEGCKNTDLFYDEVHPSPKSNMILSNKIIEHYSL